MKTSKTSKFNERLELDEELLCFNGNTLLEKVKVVSVDKKAKLVTLSNQVIISRYPDSKGLFAKQGKNASLYVVKRWDEESEVRYNAYISRSKVSTLLPRVIKLINGTSNPITSDMSDMEVLIKLESRLTKILKDKF